jgi:hypothetical protein
MRAALIDPLLSKLAQAEFQFHKSLKRRAENLQHGTHAGTNVVNCDFPNATAAARRNGVALWSGP